MDGVVPGLDCGEGVDGMPGVGLPVVVERGGEDVLIQISAAGVAAVDGTSDA